MALYEPNEWKMALKETNERGSTPNAHQLSVAVSYLRSTPKYHVLMVGHSDKEVWFPKEEFQKNQFDLVTVAVDGSSAVVTGRIFTLRKRHILPATA